jgi:PhnB protein
MMPVKPVPDGFQTVTLYLMVHDGAALIDFAVRAFGAVEMHRMLRPDGGIMHAQLQIGSSFVMLGDASEQWPAMPTGLYLYVEDADATFTRAIEAGAKPLMPLMDQFWGDRMGGVADPQGNHGWIATHIEDVPEAEMPERAKAAMAAMAAGCQPPA